MWVSQLTLIHAVEGASPQHVLITCRVKHTQIIVYSAVCLTTGPKCLPKRFLHIVRSKASSFKWEYPLLFLRSSSSFLRLLPRLPVTSICPFIFPLITCFRRQFYLAVIQFMIVFVSANISVFWTVIWCFSETFFKNAPTNRCFLWTLCTAAVNEER